MKANQIRQTFLDFFKSKQHQIVPSAPLVIKNDPTLLFTNAGMNQFKDLFLGNQPIVYPRIADTQKCLRVSGKHNDLEEVGVDTYHHTMFEMLGNWSFGDYFKKEAIAWSWELLTEVYKIDKSQLYVTVFEGNTDEGLAFDQEAYDCWKQYIAEDRIIRGNKKDNFWEMGDTGPCGPCTEIHVDIRLERNDPNVPTGKSLVNQGHPQVVEIWNNVFMEFNRKADGSLEKLPAQHVDTGMGFERLCMVLQTKQSNYDTDVFQPLIQHLANSCGKHYHQSETTDIALRVIADHIRAISFSIADGQLPSNTGAGYVIRRILRRAVRYGYQSLGFKEPFMFKLSAVLVEQLHPTFPELKREQQLIENVIREEETSFFKTLEKGLNKTERIVSDPATQRAKQINGKDAFELYDTYGFPIDLTQLLARENHLSVDMQGFDVCMQQQKSRSREATLQEADDWMTVSAESEIANNSNFVGYSQLTIENIRIIKYRKVKSKNKEHYQLVLSQTPFYAESGGQVGDTGFIENQDERIAILDTKKENGINIHITATLPKHPEKLFKATVDAVKRASTESNHSATHLLHAALRKVLGNHVEQKGSLVNDEYLRFDFSHFAKVQDDDLRKIEALVNAKIAEDLPSHIQELPLEEARKSGAMALFGEKYGERVRVVTFDQSYSIELCGGTHVRSTGKIRRFRIISESAVAAGIRRIEAITADKAEQYLQQQVEELNAVKELLKNPKDLRNSIQALLDKNAEVTSQVDQLLKEKVQYIKHDLLNKIELIQGIPYIAEKIDLNSAASLKDLSFELKNEINNLFLVLATEVNGKPTLSIIVSDELVASKKMDAGKIVRELAKEIKGGGGGQPFYATAGGTANEGLTSAIEKSKAIFLTYLS